MAKKSRAARRKEIAESLREANVGCLLMFIAAIGSPLVAVGGVFVGLGIHGALEQARLITTATPIPATILSSDTRSSTTSAGSGRSISHFARIEFEYEHGGVARTSERIWPVGEGGSAAAMRAVAARFPPGSEVTAFVDPADPEVAFLEKRWSRGVYASVFMGLAPLSFVATLGVVLAGWRRPGVALVFAIAIGLVIAGIGGASAAHYLREPPASARASWLWLVFAGGALMAAAPLLGTLKARQLHRIYASEGSGSRGAMRAL